MMRQAPYAISVLTLSLVLEHLNQILLVLGFNSRSLIDEAYDRNPHFENFVLVGIPMFYVGFGIVIKMSLKMVAEHCLAKNG